MAYRITVAVAAILLSFSVHPLAVDMQSPCPIATGCAVKLKTSRPHVTGITISGATGSAGNVYPRVLVRVESYNAIPADS